MNQALFDYIAACPTAYHAADHTASILRNAGYTELYEHKEWTLEAGKGYFTTRNGSSLIAFRAPVDGDFAGFMMTAAHGDSPCFKIKENAEMSDGHHLRLSVEKYGGMLCSSWTDRPLSVAGRVILRTDSGISTRLVDLAEPCAIIPNVAIHMNRNANDGMSYNPAVDMIPLCGEASDAGMLRKKVAEAIGVTEEDILTTDLFLYNPQRGVEWNGYVSAPRLDDLQCGFASLTAFVEAGKTAAPNAVPVFCLFDNEEVGSETTQGAASTFLRDTLLRISGSDAALSVALENSFMVSADNAHAKHPASPEMSDPDNAPLLNGGVVIKYNASQRYATDGFSDALFRTVCERAGVKVQSYCNRADLPGGSTLGSISNTRVSVPTVDIGLPQLAMHSANETAGAEDVAMMVKALTEFYSTSLLKKGTKVYF